MFVNKSRERPKAEKINKTGIGRFKELYVIKPKKFLNVF